MPGGPLAARILAAGICTLALGSGLATASGSRANEARWAKVRLTVQLKQSIHWDTTPGAACEFAARPGTVRSLTVSGPATLTIARDGLGSPELTAAQLSGVARVGTFPSPGCGADPEPAATAEACGTYPLSVLPRLRAARVSRPEGEKLQVEIAVPRPDGRNGTCSTDSIPDGVRAQRPAAASNPFTIIGELPIDSMVPRDGSGELKSATATMLRNERTALVDPSGRRVGEFRVLQRVVLTFRP